MLLRGGVNTSLSEEDSSYIKVGLLGGLGGYLGGSPDGIGECYLLGT